MKIKAKVGKKDFKDRTADRSNNLFEFKTRNFELKKCLMGMANPS